MTSSILDNPVTVNGVNTPFSPFAGQNVMTEFFNVFNMFWKYLIAIFAFVWFMYRYTMRSRSKGKGRMTGG